MDNMFKQVGMNIESLLKEQHITQAALAKKLGISKQVMHKIISGNKAINVKEIQGIAEALKTSVDNLLTREQTENEEPLFCFMGCPSKPETHEKICMVRNIIEEIIFLEDYLRA